MEVRSEIPVISVAGLVSDCLQTRRQTAAELGKACREIGFFYVKDHGIPQNLLSMAFNAAKNLFDMPLDFKNRLSITQSPHNRGYIAMSDEQLNPNAGADTKEAFNIGGDLPGDHPDVIAGKPFRGANFWPELPGWKTHVQEYFAACLGLGRKIHRGFSLDLGLPEGFFEQHLDDPIATLRMLHYPASSNYCEREDGGAETHTDYGNITILATDGVAGLQIRTRGGEWIEAPSISGTLVCNIGDCLMRWTNNTYISTPHRVRPPERERYSIAFFLEVNPDSVVDPSDIFPHQSPEYDPVTCADYLTMRLDATYGHRRQE
ncbi:isopenicillin N synthase family dioxygenase [Hahella ganghwensis]|uniref:isopenicillin N synthase family dioxygenase n=1 Tax=Hahella ganghwensis TaxID=286420 RepID=UPI00036D80BF|nr:2-oxoglutarate and iron-dependent oxygenase domain-containing protein [Hahella ganghwensis]